MYFQQVITDKFSCFFYQWVLYFFLILRRSSLFLVVNIFIPQFMPVIIRYWDNLKLLPNYISKYGFYHFPVIQKQRTVNFILKCNDKCLVRCCSWFTVLDCCMCRGIGCF